MHVDVLGVCVPATGTIAHRPDVTGGYLDDLRRKFYNLLMNRWNYTFDILCGYGS